MGKAAAKKTDSDLISASKISRKTPEGSVKFLIKKWLDNRGWYYHMSVQTGYGRRTLDFLICRGDGRFLATEAKRKDGKAQGFQKKLVRDIVRKGGEAFICHSFEHFLLKVEPAL